MIEFRDNRVYVCGDTHSTSVFKNVIEDIPNFVDIIHIGDVGVGFNGSVNIPFYKAQLEKINAALAVKDCRCFAIRGNHDNPSWWPQEFSNLFLVDDYTEAEFPDGRKALLVGGGVSVDRCIRKVGKDYWREEVTKLIPEGLGECDIVFAHDCPSCFNYSSESLPINWKWCCDKDPTLYDEASAQRKTLDKVAEICQPKHWIYGHFHNDAKQDKAGIKASCINICNIVSVEQDGKITKQN